MSSICFGFLVVDHVRRPVFGEDISPIGYVCTKKTRDCAKLVGNDVRISCRVLWIVLGIDGTTIWPLSLLPISIIHCINVQEASLAHRLFRYVFCFHENLNEKSCLVRTCFTYFFCLHNYFWLFLHVSGAPFELLIVCSCSR